MSLMRQMPKAGKQGLILGAFLFLMISTLTLWAGEGRPYRKKSPGAQGLKISSMIKPKMLFTQNILQQQTLINPEQSAPPVEKAAAKPQPNPEAVVRTRPVGEDEFPWLARIIHAEAGGESVKGQVAVGAVLLNRIKSGKFPRSIKANIFRPGEFESVSNGYIWSNPSSSSYRAARLALKGWDPTHGSLYFFNPAKSSSKWIWSRPIYTVIGQHNFAG